MELGVPNKLPTLSAPAGSYYLQQAHLSHDRLKVRHKFAGAYLDAKVLSGSGLLDNPAATADLIAFLQTRPEGRQLRGVRIYSGPEVDDDGETWHAHWLLY